MNKIYNKLVSIVFVLALVILELQSPYNAYAQYYSEGESKPVIVVDKKIGYSGEKNYFDNVNSDQKLFVEGDLIIFKIVIENKGEINLSDVKVKDYLPKYLQLMFYPGVYSKVNNTLETQITELKSGESKEYLVIAKIKDVPTSVYANSKFQLTNSVSAFNNMVTDSDSAKYYVGYKGVPSTGADDIVIKTIMVIASSLTALGLRKKARGY